MDCNSLLRDSSRDSLGHIHDDSELLVLVELGGADVGIPIRLPEEHCDLFGFDTNSDGSNTDLLKLNGFVELVTRSCSQHRPLGSTIDTPIAWHYWNWKPRRDCCTQGIVLDSVHCVD